MSGIKFSNTTPAAPGGQALVTFQADGQGHISAAYTPGGGPNLATATVDFGFAAGNEGDTVVVTVPAAWVTVNSKIVCQVASVATADHDPDDAAVEGIFALAQNIVAGVSFDILAVAPNNTWGRYTIFAWGF